MVISFRHIKFIINHNSVLTQLTIQVQEASEVSPDPPPSYDQLATVELDRESTLLSDTFPGSIFGTSASVTFELANGHFPSIMN